MIRALCYAAPLLLAVAAARAQVPLSGSFTASRACPALQSIRQQSNPGNVTVQPGQAYPVTGKNRLDATFYQIMVEGARRWVSVDCGQIGGGATASNAPAPGQRATHVLALGWEPAFCRQHMDKAECSSMTARSEDATELSMHGLWPQPRGTAYCNVDRNLVEADRSHHWDALPEPEISAATRQSLGAVMPGLESGLERHEWIVHGTCFGTSADAYFARAASLVRQANAAPVRDLFVQNLGATVTADAIRGAFDKAFGPGAGARVMVSCSGDGQNRHISELVVSLAGDVAGSAKLGDLIQAAAPVQPGCPSGIVDRPGR
jgi:ribonuclease T2